MDNLIGDDIDVGVRQVVRQLLNLASDPDSQVLMAQQPEFIPGLVGYMSNEDIEVRLMAARAIEFLSTHPNNKDIIARSPGLVPKMKELADSENEHARAISRRTLYNIKNFLPSEDVTFVKEHPIDSMPDVKQGVTTVKTYTFSLESTSNTQVLEDLQSVVIKIPGVTSITIEKQKKKIVVTVRQMEGDNKEREIQDTINRFFADKKEPGIFKDDDFVDDLFDKEDGDQALATYGFSSIESSLEKKKKEREAKQKKEKKRNWLFDKVSSAMSKWW